jgi:heme exporter protein A
MTAGAMLEARAINVWRGERHILRDVSFIVTTGECLRISGPNGVGKTTLLRVLCGLLRPESGEAFWRGRGVGQPTAEYTAELAYVGHVNALKADLTARENLAFTVGVRRPVADAEVAGALERVGLAECAHLPVRVLSAGQRRRLALARLSLWPALLWVLDEPATNLDAAGLSLVESMIREQLRRGGLAVVAAHQRLFDADADIRRLELA